MMRCGTVSGRIVDLVAPDWRDIDLLDIAQGLSQINRFAGQSRLPIPVTAHSLVVGDLAPPALRLPALLHDGHEALFGDWTTPAVAAVAVMLQDEGRFVGAIGLIKFRLDAAIARRLLEDIAAVAEISLAEEAVNLAREMRFGGVVDADHAALGLEQSFRERGAAGPEAERARALYRCEPDGGLPWLAAVRAAARARYGARP